MEAIAVAAAQATGLRDYRARVLTILGDVARFDAALMHALSPRVPLTTAVLHGIEPAALARSRERWDELADVLSPLRSLANRRLVATDMEALPPRSKARRRLEAIVLRPFGQRAVCMVHLVVQERVVGAVVLLAKRATTFDASTVAQLRRIAPVVAIGDALHQRIEGGPAASMPIGLRCEDQRLTVRQRDVVEHVALGLTNREIGAALGITVHAVRNHLARAFEAIGASNRADVVRRAVLVPKPGR